MVAHTFTSSTQEAEAGGSLPVLGYPGLQKGSSRTASATQRNSISKTKTKNKSEIKNKLQIRISLGLER